MKVLYLHQYFNTPDMSGGTRSYEFARRLVAGGHEVHMVTSDRTGTRGNRWYTTKEDGINVHWLTVPYSNRMSYPQRIGAFCTFALAATQKALNLPADVVFATSTPLTIAIPAVRAAHKKQRPMVFEVRDLWPDVPIAVGAIRNRLFINAARALERYAYNNAAHVIALSPGMKEGVAAAGYPSEKISVIPNGADLDLFRRDSGLGKQFRQRAGIAESNVVVGYAGALGRINGVEYLIHLAVEMIPDTNVTFLIVGDGQERSRIQQLAVEKGVLGKNVTMLNRVSKSEMSAVMSAFDISTSLVLPVPELETNSANKFFDGMASECCLAINYGGWQADLLKGANAGIVLDRDPRVAADQIRALSISPARIREMGVNAWQLGKREFAREVLAQRFESVLYEVTQSRQCDGSKDCR